MTAEAMGRDTIEKLEAQLAAQADEIASLRGEIAALRAESGDAAPSAAALSARPATISRWGMMKAVAATMAAGLGMAALRPSSAEAANGAPLVLGHSSTTHNANGATETTEVRYKGRSKVGLGFLVNDTDFVARGAAWPAAMGAWAGKHLPHGLFAYTNGKKAAKGLAPSAVAAFSLHGYGGYFSGRLAPISLEPAAGQHPGTGKAGDLFVDANADLWFCKGGTDWYHIV